MVQNLTTTSSHTFDRRRNRCKGVSIDITVFRTEVPLQNRYVGDIGDFAKYSLLNALSEERRLGVAWYLYPDEEHNDDGKHTSYLDEPDTWRGRSPKVFDGLRQLVRLGSRDVVEVVGNQIIFPHAVSDEPLSFLGRRSNEKSRWREDWFSRVQSDLRNCDIVFADPDNGLCLDERFKSGVSKDWKRLPLSEAKRLAEGRMAVIYHHNSRFKGGHAKENIFWAEKLETCSFAVRFRAYSSRTFFVINADSRAVSAAEKWVKCMGEKAELMIGRHPFQF